MRAILSVAALVAISMQPPDGQASKALGAESGNDPVQERPEAKPTKPEISKSVQRLVDQLKKQSVKPAKGLESINLYMIDLQTRETTLVASQPQEGFDCCGSAAWSNDGRRILYDTMPRGNFSATLIKSLSVGEGGVEATDVGPGNCPSFSADDERIIFLNNSSGVANDKIGIWIMQADGSNRRPLDGYGRTKWSSDGHRFLVIAFDLPCTVTVIDDRPAGKSGQIEIPGKKMFRNPSWAGDGIIVAPLGRETADSIALIDVNNPSQGSIREILWTRGKDLDVEPSYPLYLAETRRVVFVGTDKNRHRALYMFERGKKTPPTRLEPGTQSNAIDDLAPAPDGRYVLFSSVRGK